MGKLHQLWSLEQMTLSINKRIILMIPYPFKVDIEGPRRHRLLQDTNIYGYTIPKGFITDGASVPQRCWFVISPYTEAYPAAIVHDYMYVNPYYQITRREADNIFFRNLRKNGVACRYAWLAWLAVRIFGRFAFAPRINDTP